MKLICASLGDPLLLRLVRSGVGDDNGGVVKGRAHAGRQHFRLASGGMGAAATPAGRGSALGSERRWLAGPAGRPLSGGARGVPWR